MYSNRITRNSMIFKEIIVSIIAAAILSILMTGLTFTITRKYNYKEKPEINSTQTTTYTIRF